MSKYRVVVARWVAAALVAMAAAGCSEGTASDPAAQPVRADGSADDAVDQVVAISVDGLNPAAIRRLGAARAPAYHRLISQGAATLNARSLHENTRTLPNHTSMVTGRQARGPGGHGVRINHDDGGNVHARAGEYVASMFSVVHDRGGGTAFYAAKTKFAYLDRSWNAQRGAADDVGEDDGRDKIDRFLVDDEADLVSRLIRQLRTNPDELSFLHLGLPDGAGHRHGFMGPEYLDAVHDTDVLVGRVLAAVASDPDLRAHTVVVLTADHGGSGADHTDPESPANYTVPFMVWGMGVARGADLYGLNTGSFGDPGTAHADYTGRQPIRNGAVANLVTDLLDLPAVPGSQVNPDQTLSVTR